MCSSSRGRGAHWWPTDRKAGPMNLQGKHSMKMSIKLALLTFAAVMMATAMPLTTFADDATPEGGNNCSDVRTTTNSRCVHYNEKAHDGWANQQSEKGFLKANPPTSVTVDHQRRRLWACIGNKFILNEYEAWPRRQRRQALFALEHQMTTCFSRRGRGATAKVITTKARTCVGLLPFSNPGSSTRREACTRMP